MPIIHRYKNVVYRHIKSSHYWPFSHINRQIVASDWLDSIVVIHVALPMKPPRMHLR